MTTRPTGARLPDFLIVGAMKCGTTTLYRDLADNPAIAFTSFKEPRKLLTDDVLTTSGTIEYADLYREAGDGQLLGDASTNYTMLPDHPGVAERARAVLGGDIRIVYIVRDPIERIVSHHFHDFRRSDAGPDIDAAVRTHHRYVAYSQYARQARPWVDAFGNDRFLAVDFHAFTDDRNSVVRSIEAFLGVPSGPPIPVDRIYNQGDTARDDLSGFWAKVERSRAYALVRPLMSYETRDKLKQTLLRRPPSRPDPPSPDTVAWLIDELADDIDRQPSTLGWASVPWPVESLAARHLA